MPRELGVIVALIALPAASAFLGASRPISVPRGHPRVVDLAQPGRAALASRSNRAAVREVVRVGGRRGGASMLRASGDNDLLVIGAGVLGGLLIEQHRAMFPDAGVVAETRTTDKHAALMSKGATCRTVDDAPMEPQPNVVFCAAPGANPDYPGEVAKALARWSGTGKFVFTSSGGVYAEDDGQYVDEQSTVSDSARAKKLLDCESAVLAKGGSVVRLAGLYSLERGAHNYWLKAGSVDARPDGLIGLVSYEDAAGSVLSVLACERSKVAGEVFLICDGVEQSREDICTAALTCALYKDGSLPTFGKSEGPLGKRYNVNKASSVLGWKPKYESFSAFCALHANAT